MGCKANKHKQKTPEIPFIFLQLSPENKGILMYSSSLKLIPLEKIKFRKDSAIGYLKNSRIAIGGGLDSKNELTYDF